MYEANLKPVSNRADWIETIELVDDDTNDVIEDLSGVEVFIEVRSRDPYHRCLSGSVDDGHIILIPGGVIQWQFTANEMHSLCAGTYEVGITVVRDGITEQELIGSLPVLDGVMRR
jgi:hypothetical protein